MGLSAALVGSAVLLAGPRLEHLAPFWPLILADYGVTVVLYMGLALAAVAAALYGLARAAALADLGRRVDLVERSVRRGEGDPELTRAHSKGRLGPLGLKASGCLVLRLSATPPPFDTRLARAVPDLADPQKFTIRQLLSSGHH